MVSADVQIFKCVTHERWKTNFVHLHTIHTVEQTYIHISWGALNMQDLKMLDIDMNLADHRRHTGHKIAAHENTGKKGWKQLPGGRWYKFIRWGLSTTPVVIEIGAGVWLGYSLLLAHIFSQPTS